MATLAKIPNGLVRCGVVKKHSQTIDFSLINMAQNDVQPMIDVPDNTLVQSVRYIIERGEGAARSFSIGDVSGPAGYIASTSAINVGEGITSLSLTDGAPNTVSGFSAGKFYTDPGTIDLVALTAGGLTAGKIRVEAVMTHFE